MAKRTRETIQVQLEITRGYKDRDRNLAILDYIEKKAKKYQKATVIVNALMLYENLECEQTHQLLEQFPKVYQLIRDEIIRDLLGNMSAMNFSGTGRAKSGKTDDIEIEFEIKRDTTTNPGENFINSLMGVSGTQLTVASNAPKQLNVPSIDTPVFDDDEDVFS